MPEFSFQRLLLDFGMLAVIALFTGIPVMMIRQAWCNWNRLLRGAGEHAFQTASARLGEAWPDA